ncbi:MAG TPA: VWA domain-containing protein [Candidatus Sulfotelmatobacter sp.]|nr:VWA domain-containing protein [Candidatus Sulfotelmatobacter sp.]
MHLAGIRKSIVGITALVSSMVVAAAQTSTPAMVPYQASSSNSQPASPQAAAPQASPDAPIANDQSSDQSGAFVFKKQVDEVVLHATVVNDRGALETHLDRAAFAVFEDGIPQTVTSFRRQDVPVAIGVVIDNSGSMRDKRAEVNQSVLNLVRASNPDDEVFVVNFGRNPYLDQDFTSDVHLLETALHQTSTQGSTALYDAIYASATHLRNNPRLEKRILLVITDGKDNMSRKTLEETQKALQQDGGPTLYAIGLMDGQNQFPGREALQRLADATGGAAFFPASLEQVRDITRSLAHDIRSQYIIAYRPHIQNPKANYHPIRVEAHAPGYADLVVRTRKGIYTGESVR